MVKNSGVDGVGVGNTDSTPDNGKGSKCTRYCWTLNNYNMCDIDDIILWCKNNTKKYIFGLEVGENGTPHLQGFFCLIKQARITTLKNVKCLCKMHFEKCKGSDNDNIKYCMKDGKIYYGGDINIPAKVNIIKDLYKWQTDLEEILINCNSDRFIYWIYENEGNAGKTSFIKYMYDKYKCLICAGGKKGDVINLVFNGKEYLCSMGKKMILWNIPRCNKDGISFNALEEVKDGIIVNYKFETGCFICNSPTICIFSNCLPDVSKLSLDRWKIYKIVMKELIFINNIININFDDNNLDD